MNSADKEEKLVELEAKTVSFFSPKDESAFFSWIDKIPSVVNVRGAGLSIVITVDTDRTDEVSLRELIALFWRYDISLKQLSVFDREEFKDWFRDKNSFWFKEIFV